MGWPYHSFDCVLYIFIFLHGVIFELGKDVSGRGVGYNIVAVSKK